MNRLLILSCSQRKNPLPTPLPATSRYDGVNFRVLRKLERIALLPDAVRIFVVSAEYGLLHGSQMIDLYDRRMTPARAAELSGIVSARLDSEIAVNAYSEVFINMGRAYLPALADSRMLKQLPVVYASGGIGKKMAQMRKWILLPASSQDVATAKSPA